MKNGNGARAVVSGRPGALCAWLRQRARAYGGTLAVAVIFSAGLAETARAQQSAAAEQPGTAAFNIAAQPLDSALSQFGALTGIQVIYDSNLSRSIRSNPVSGTLTPRAALERMLWSSGLSPRFTGGQTVTLTRSGASTAMAQADASGAIVLDEITVQGEKVARDYFRTYTSVGVVTGQEISDYNVTDLKQTFDMMANVRSYPASGNSGYVIRGLNSEGVTGPSARSAPIVSVIVDGAIQNTEATRRGVRGVWDVEQIEVLRGPQSTLQGRNSLGGAVNVKTKDPTYTPEFIVDGQFGSQDFRSGAFALNTPLVPNQVAVRVAGQTMRETKDITFTDPALASMGRDEFEQIRAKLLITPDAIPGLKALFTFNRAHDKPGVNAVTGPNFFARQFNSLASSGLVENRQVYLNNYVSDISYELAPGWNLKSVTSFADTDMTIGSPVGSSLMRNDLRKGSDFAQDVRLAFDPAGSPLSGVIGVFWGKFSSDVNSLITTNQLAPFGYPVVTVQDLLSDNTTTSVAGYADLRYKFWDRWTLIAGGRLLRDKVSNDVRGEALDINATFGAGFPVFSSLNENVSTSNTEFLPKIGIAYDIDANQNIAATATKGYRTGFAETVIGSTIINTVAPEFMWAYELAYRSRWLDNRLQLNGNIFYYDYKNQQVAVDNPAAVGSTITANAGKSHLYGAEIEGRWLVVEGFTVFSSIGLLKTEFDEGITNLGNLAGKRFPESPTVTASAGGIWRHQSGLFTSADVSYTDGFYSNGNLMNTSGRFVSDFTIVNANIGYESKNGSLSLFARNLFDKQYLTSINSDLAGATIGSGRIVGIRGTARF